jgi:hypothetical protein
MRAEIFSCFSSSSFGPLLSCQPAPISSLHQKRLIVCLSFSANAALASPVEYCGKDARRAELFHLSPLFGPLSAHDPKNTSRPPSLEKIIRFS